MLRYADLRSFVINNEPTVWEIQAPLVQLLAVLLPSSYPRDEGRRR